MACECVVIAETKDHQDWELLGKCALQLDGEQAQVLKAAYDAIEDQEDEHLYHTRGWCRELWVQSLGIPAVLPPPEERQKVKTAIGAARAEQSADLQRTALRSSKSARARRCRRRRRARSGPAAADGREPASRRSRTGSHAATAP